MYLTKSPWWLRKLYPSYKWNIITAERSLFLTFDDGPNEIATPFVLDELKKYRARATFFCIGKNVEKYPEIYARIIAEGHSVGNHTQDHLDGWKTKRETYLQNVDEAAKLINSDLFRPPYGKITRGQAKLLSAKATPYKIIMWTVLSGDFDKNISPESCFKNVVRNSWLGSIVVFHDSEKAFERMSYALPRVLKYFDKEEYRFRSF